jgi:hypothetical protein
MPYCRYTEMQKNTLDNYLDEFVTNLFPKLLVIMRKSVCSNNCQILEAVVAILCKKGEKDQF